MVLPKYCREFSDMIVTARPFNPDTDDVHDLLLREEVKEEMLQKEFSGDKGRAVKANRIEINRVKAYLAKDNNKDKSRTQRWQGWLDKLYAQRFGLFRDSYLSMIKRKTGDITTESLEQIEGSPQWQAKKKRDKENKQANKSKSEKGKRK